MIKPLKRISSSSKWGWVLLFVFLCLGCASEKASLTLLSGVTKEGAPVCLDDRTGIPAAVQEFYAKRDLTTEEGKIDYLLERLRNSKLLFIRNRVEYTGPQAAGFLRWKLDRWKTHHHLKIDTAQEFVDWITSGSKMSGEPYVVILKDGGQHDLRKVFQNELDALEVCLKQLPPSTPRFKPGEGIPAVPGSTAEVSPGNGR